MPSDIREAQLTDVPELVKLVHELGHEGDEATLRRRLDRVLHASEHVVFVSESRPHGLVGMVHASVVATLLGWPHCEIEALVVTTSHRGLGLGRGLLERVHGWALRRGLDEVILRASRHRKAAHRLLGKLGYTMREEQRVFIRNLADRPDDEGSDGSPSTAMD